jgi:hypothetical protein
MYPCFISMLDDIVYGCRHNVILVSIRHRQLLRLNYGGQQNFPYIYAPSINIYYIFRDLYHMNWCTNQVHVDMFGQLGYDETHLLV